MRKTANKLWLNRKKNLSYHRWQVQLFLFCFYKRRNDLVITWSILAKFLDTFLPFLKTKVSLFSVWKELPSLSFVGPLLCVSAVWNHQCDYNSLVTRVGRWGTDTGADCPRRLLFCWLGYNSRGENLLK